MLGLPGKSPLISITCRLFIFSHTLSIHAGVHLDSLPIVQVASPTQCLLIPVIADKMFPVKDGQDMASLSGSDGHFLQPSPTNATLCQLSQVIDKDYDKGATDALVVISQSRSAEPLVSGPSGHENAHSPILSRTFAHVIWIQLPPRWCQYPRMGAGHHHLCGTGYWHQRPQADTGHYHHRQRTESSDKDIGHPR